MRNYFTNRTVFALSVTLALILLSSDTQSQQRRRRPSRRSTHPVRTQTVPPPTPVNSQTSSEATIISTADEPPPPVKENNTTNKQAKSNPAPQRSNNNAEADQERMRSTIDKLSGQVLELSQKLTQMREQQNTLVDLERLSRAEQRVESFRTQLRDVLDKESAFQARLEQIDYELRPESIQMRAATIGTLRPDEVRDAIRRQLESERTRIRTQLDQLSASRVRLEAAIATAEREADRIRARIEAADQAQAAGSTNASNETRPTSTETRPASPPAKPTATPEDDEVPF